MRTMAVLGEKKTPSRDLYGCAVVLELGAAARAAWLTNEEARPEDAVPLGFRV